MRFPTYGGLYVWKFERRGRKLNIHIDGHLAFNTTTHIAAAAIGGAGVACLPEVEFAPYLEDGRVVRVLVEDWCPPFPGYQLYYPGRRQPSPAFALMLDALRFRG